MKSLKRKKKIRLQNVYKNRNRDFQFNDIRKPINTNIIMESQLFENYQNLYEETDERKRYNKSKNKDVLKTTGAGVGAAAVGASIAGKPAMNHALKKIIKKHGIKTAEEITGNPAHMAKVLKTRKYGRRIGGAVLATGAVAGRNAYKKKLRKEAEASEKRNVSESQLFENYQDWDNLNEKVTAEARAAYTKKLSDEGADIHSRSRKNGFKSVEKEWYNNSKKSLNNTIKNVNAKERNEKAEKLWKERKKKIRIKKIKKAGKIGAGVAATAGAAYAGKKLYDKKKKKNVSESQLFISNKLRSLNENRIENTLESQVILSKIALKEAAEEYKISPKQFLKDINIVKNLKSMCESQAEFKIAKANYFEDQMNKAFEKGNDEASEYYESLID
jgi:hypothetical protein